MIKPVPVPESEHVIYTNILPVIIKATYNAHLEKFKSIYIEYNPLLIAHKFNSINYYSSVLNKLRGNGILSGGSYINNIDTVFDSNISLYHMDIKIKEQITNNGKFNFKYLNPSYTYDVKATPLNTDFNPRVVPNLKPVIDNSGFRFLFYCHYDKIYKSGKPYTIRTVAYDTRGILKFNMDGAPIGMSIDENTGVISFNLSTIGTYNFTVNCSDSLLELTKSIPMEIEIIA